MNNYGTNMKALINKTKNIVIHNFYKFCNVTQ
jgi:hypothetical protein